MRTATQVLFGFAIGAASAALFIALMVIVTNLVTR